MDTEPTTTEAPAQPENVTPMTPPASLTPEQVEEMRRAVEDDMKDAIPFNRLAIHNGFQQVIQAAISGPKPEKAGTLCSAFRNYAEAETLLRG